MSETSTKPYMIRALYEWCCDNGYTPYLAVAVDRNTRVPRQHVKAGEIVLNVSPMATNRLQLGNEHIEFQARFSGVAHEISIPIGNVSAIYARETGHGMAFEVAKPPALVSADGQADDLQGIDSAMPEGTDGAPSSDPAGGPAAVEPTRAPRVPRRRGPRAVESGDHRERASISTLRDRSVSGDGNGGGAEVISFATSGASRRKKAASDKAASDKAASDKAASDKAASEDGSGVGARRDASSAAEDDLSLRRDPPGEAPDVGGGTDPSPAGGGAGGAKAGKARLTRVK